MFKIEVTSLREAMVTNIETKEQYKVKVEPYTRTKKDGTRQVCRQVRVDGIPGNQLSSGVVQVREQLDKATNKYKLKVTFEHSLSREYNGTSDFAESFV